MSNLKSILYTCCFCIFIIGCGDTNAKKSAVEETPKAAETIAKQDTSKQLNLLDEQAKMFGKIFGKSNSEEGDKWKNVNNYMDLVEQANFPPDVKQNILDQYKLYELSLDPKKKDSLKLVFSQKLNEAMAKSVSNPK